jgi:hypothetical protein
VAICVNIPGTADGTGSGTAGETEGVRTLTPFVDLEEVRGISIFYKIKNFFIILLKIEIDLSI